MQISQITDRAELELIVGLKKRFARPVRKGARLDDPL